MKSYLLFFCLKMAGRRKDMAVSEAGLATLGVKFGYAVETTAGEKPAAFTWLERCNSISGLELSTEQIDKEF